MPDRVTSLLPFPPTWYNVLGPPRLRRRGTTGAEGTQTPVGSETGSPSSERAPRLLLWSLLTSSHLLAPGHYKTLLLAGVSYGRPMLQNHSRGKLLAASFPPAGSSLKEFSGSLFPFLPSLTESGSGTLPGAKNSNDQGVGPPSSPRATGRRFSEITPRENG